MTAVVRIGYPFNITTTKHNRNMIQNTIFRKCSINCKNVVVLAQKNYMKLKGKKKNKKKMMNLTSVT